MHSKWQIWDFFSSFDRNFLAHAQGGWALNTFDAHCLKLIKEFLVRGAQNKILHYKMASEITSSWIEEEFQTLSLFGDSDNFFIHQAQDLSHDLLEQMSGLDLQGRFVILSFENEGSAWKKIIKESKIESIQVEAPRFWEMNKLLDFVSVYLRLPLGYESKNWILNSLENDLGTFYNACCLIKLNWPDSKEIGLSEVMEILKVEKLDQFLLASLFCRGKKIDFYEKIIGPEKNFERMRLLFNFMQSHLIKLADTSYLGQKPRLSQYDKELQNTSKLWKSSDIIIEIERFNKWEVMCKKKDILLWHELRKSYLMAMGNNYN